MLILDGVDPRVAALFCNAISEPIVQVKKKKCK